MKIQKHSKWKREEGFTLIELIIGIVITGILGGFGVQFLTSSMSMNQQMAGRKDLVDDAKIAFERMVREIRFADSVTLNSSTSITITKPAYPEDAATTVIFTYVGNSIQRNGTAIGTLADNVSAFSIVEVGTNFYEISATLTKSNSGTFQLLTAVYPRIEVPVT
jgi:prepilin-type N-terminal cleavage/methylation domain-containing protein